MNKLWISLALTCLLGCTPSSPAPPAAGAENGGATAAVHDPEQQRKRTSDGVFTPYAADQFPKLFSMLGAGDPTARIQALREAAASHALSSGRCDRVELSEISSTRSTKANLIAFVDCTNRERFYVSEGDVAAQAPAVANSEMTISAGVAIERCVTAARSLATYPALVDPHVWTGSSFTSNKTTGNARVLLDFDATNAFGVKLPYRANCLFPAGSTTPELHVQAR